MPLKFYVPLSILFFALVLAVVNHFGIPVLPFAFVILAAETLLGFQVENHKVSQRLSGVVSALKPNQKMDDPRAH